MKMAVNTKSANAGDVWTKTGIFASALIAYFSLDSATDFMVMYDGKPGVLSLSLFLISALGIGGLVYFAHRNSVAGVKNWGRYCIFSVLVWLYLVLFASLQMYPVALLGISIVLVFASNRFWSMSGVARDNASSLLGLYALFLLLAFTGVALASVLSSLQSLNQFVISGLGGIALWFAILLNGLGFLAPPLQRRWDFRTVVGHATFGAVMGVGMLMVGFHRLPT